MVVVVRVWFVVVVVDAGIISGVALGATLRLGTREEVQLGAAAGADGYEQ